MSMEIPPYCRGVDDERHRSRIAAFGAIRRAVEVARGYERHHDGGFIEYVTALRIRQAIRAAIGSPKA